ncbi:MAG TPA: hypothetical protein VGB55_05165, partial [Tepidisphaeraceae bacterium]
DVSYKAAADGQLFLYDKTNSELVQTFNIEKGQRLTVSPEGDAIAVDGKTITRGKGLSKRAEYRLLFAD